MQEEQVSVTAQRVAAHRRTFDRVPAPSGARATGRPSRDRATCATANLRPPPRLSERQSNLCDSKPLRLRTLIVCTGKRETWFYGAPDAIRGLSGHFRHPQGKGESPPPFGRALVFIAALGMGLTDATRVRQSVSQRTGKRHH